MVGLGRTHPLHQQFRLLDEHLQEMIDPSYVVRDLGLCPDFMQGSHVSRYIQKVTPILEDLCWCS